MPLDRILNREISRINNLIMKTNDCNKIKCLVDLKLKKQKLKSLLDECKF